MQEKTRSSTATLSGEAYSVDQAAKTKMKETAKKALSAMLNIKKTAMELEKATTKLQNWQNQVVEAGYPAAVNASLDAATSAAVGRIKSQLQAENLASGAQEGDYAKMVQRFAGVVLNMAEYNRRYLTSFVKRGNETFREKEADMVASDREYADVALLNAVPYLDFASRVLSPSDRSALAGKYQALVTEMQEGKQVAGKGYDAYPDPAVFADPQLAGAALGESVGAVHTAASAVGAEAQAA